MWEAEGLGGARRRGQGAGRAALPPLLLLRQLARARRPARAASPAQLAAAWRGSGPAGLRCPAGAQTWRQVARLAGRRRNGGVAGWRGGAKNRVDRASGRVVHARAASGGSAHLPPSQHCTAPTTALQTEAQLGRLRWDAVQHTGGTEMAAPSRARGEGGGRAGQTDVHPEGACAHLPRRTGGEQAGRGCCCVCQHARMR